eukprot:7627463-Lingulodinium_polyedra.AAC.1
MLGAGRAVSPWQVATVATFPKPGKPPFVENLREIGLLLTLGKACRQIVRAQAVRVLAADTASASSMPPAEAPARPT